jgi:hypothetical protein
MLITSLEIVSYVQCQLINYECAYVTSFNRNNYGIASASANFRLAANVYVHVKNFYTKLLPMSLSFSPLTAHQLQDVYPIRISLSTHFW